MFSVYWSSVSMDSSPSPSKSTPSSKRDRRPPRRDMTIARVFITSVQVVIIPKSNPASNLPAGLEHNWKTNTLQGRPRIFCSHYLLKIQGTLCNNAMPFFRTPWGDIAHDTIERVPIRIISEINY